MCFHFCEYLWVRNDNVWMKLSRKYFFHQFQLHFIRRYMYVYFFKNHPNVLHEYLGTDYRYNLMANPLGCFIWYIYIPWYLEFYMQSLIFLFKIEQQLVCLHCAILQCYNRPILYTNVYTQTYLANHHRVV